MLRARCCAVVGAPPARSARNDGTPCADVRVVFVARSETYQYYDLCVALRWLSEAPHASHTALSAVFALHSPFCPPEGGAAKKPEDLGEACARV